MGTIAVHEFITLNGVIDTPSWTFDYPFDPKMGEAISGIMDRAGRSCSGGTRTRCSRRSGPPGPPSKTPAHRS